MKQIGWGCDSKERYLIFFPMYTLAYVWSSDFWKKRKEIILRFKFFLLWNTENGFNEKLKKIWKKLNRAGGFFFPLTHG